MEEYAADLSRVSTFALHEGLRIEYKNQADSSTHKDAQKYTRKIIWRFPRHGTKAGRTVLVMYGM